jgi:hypothetical protein
MGQMGEAAALIINIVVVASPRMSRKTEKSSQVTDCKGNPTCNLAEGIQS